MSWSSGTDSSGLLGREEFTSIISLPNKSSVTTPDGNQGPFPSTALQHDTSLNVVQQETERRQVLVYPGLAVYICCSQKNDIPSVCLSFWVVSVILGI